MFLRGHHQNAYVTHDLDRAIERMSKRFGIEKFDRMDPEMTIKTSIGEQPLRVRVASTWVGGLNIEIIQPVSGYVDHYATMLPADRSDPTPRFHHMSFRRDDEAQMREEVARLGLPVAFEGPMAITGPVPPLIFMYLDARETVGHYLEYTWKSPEGWKYVGWPQGRSVL